MTRKPRKAALYVRVSTPDQTVENQVAELERVAEFRGWQVTARYSDEGISGAKGTIRERVKAGMGRARSELAKNGKYVARRSGIVRRSLGRPGADPDKLAEARRLLKQGHGILKVAKGVGLGTGTVQRLKREAPA